MIRLHPPKRQYARDLEAILASVRNVQRKRRLQKGRTQSLRVARQYQKVSPSDRNFKSKLIGSVGDAFIYYWENPVSTVKEIKVALHSSLPQDHKNRCPYCRLPRELDSFDHVVEKAGLPELAFYFRNLVPSCSHCNTNRQPTFDAQGRQCVLHFYDDDVDGIPDVLVARVSQVGGGVVANFSVAQSSHPMRELYFRHFQTLRLAQRYTDWASGKLSELSIELRRMRLSVVVAELSRWAVEHNQKWGKNEPTAALFRALAGERAVLRSYMGVS